MEELEKAMRSHHLDSGRQETAENRQWEYTAPPISSDYWREAGRNNYEYYIEAAESFLEQIKDIATAMRRGDGDALFDLDLYFPPEARYDGNGDCLVENQMLLDHWGELAGALYQYRHTLNCLDADEDSSFSIVNVHLYTDVFYILKPALEYMSFKNVSFRNNGFPRQCVVIALDLFRKNPRLESFSLSRNGIESRDDVNSLCEIIECHPALQGISLDGCFDRSDYSLDVMRSVIRNNTITWLSLSENVIHFYGDPFLSNWLATNPCLEYLTLSQSSINDIDANLFATALKTNTNLRQLNVRVSDITTYGGKQLLKTLIDDTSLNSAANSNHSCKVVCARIRGWEKINMRDPKSNRGEKLYNILSSRNRTTSTVKHFEDTSLKLLPSMLESVHRYSQYHVQAVMYGGGDENLVPPNESDVEALSIFHEIMRSWDKVLALYKSLGTGQMKMNWSEE